MVEPFDFHLDKPLVSEGNHHDLSLESTLQDLPLYEFEIPWDCPSQILAQMLEKYPLLPGAILQEEGEFMGMISRCRFLESLIHPHGIELFLTNPISVLYSYTRIDLLILPQDTPILTAAQRALWRSMALQAEPILVEIAPRVYRLLDVHELNIAYWQIRGIETQVRYERTQSQMIQTEKMASLGRLVDGVAHEILDPVGFIWGNLTYVQSYSESLLQLLAAYQELVPVDSVKINQLKEEIEFDFLAEDLPKAIASIQSGAHRLTKLATSLQNFCHIDEIHPKPADLHAHLDAILLLLKSRLSGEIKVIKKYGKLPPVSCYIGQLDQVFINILTNAIDALINKAVSQKLAEDFRDLQFAHVKECPQIQIITKVYSPEVTENEKEENASNQRWVYIRIADNGVGMSLRKQQKIWESFSTKTRMEKETSLAVSYQIVTAKHGGIFNMKSELEVGTEFEVMLPLL